MHLIQKKVQVQCLLKIYLGNENSPVSKKIKEKSNFETELLTGLGVKWKLQSASSCRKRESIIS